MHKFAKQADDIGAELTSAYEDRDEVMLAFHAHKLKSSAGAVGANELAGLCNQLEVAGRQENWPETDKLLPD